MQDRLRLETQMSFEEHLVKCIWRFVKKKKKNKCIPVLYCGSNKRILYNDWGMNNNCRVGSSP